MQCAAGGLLSDKMDDWATPTAAHSDVDVLTTQAPDDVDASSFEATVRAVSPFIATEGRPG